MILSNAKTTRLVQDHIAAQGAGLSSVPDADVNMGGTTAAITAKESPPAKPAADTVAAFAAGLK